MLHKTRGIVLHKTRYSENSLIVKFYTRHSGLLSVIIHGTGKSRAKSKRNLLQPLNLLELEVDLKEKKNIHPVKEIRFAYLYDSISFDMAKSSILLFLNEILYKSIKEEEPNEIMFDFIEQSLIGLDQMQDHFQNFHLDFLIRLSGFLGFNPLNNCDSENKFFHLQEGFFTPYPGPPDEVLDENNSMLLYRFLREDFREIGMNHYRRNLLLENLLNYYRHHIPHFPEIKSHQVLKEILRG